MATLPNVGDGDDLDASLWSELQRFVDLSVIYAKLPLASFFRLRQVCKEWNRLASDRKFLEQNFRPPISSNPYFILTRPGARHVLLTSEGSSWSSTLVPRVRCEASGLLLEDSGRNRVFDLHTRVVHTLPPLPPIVQAPAFLEELQDNPLISMTVDTSLIPYGFRVIAAREFIGMRIFDSISGVWTHKPSTREFCPHASGTSCAYCNKSLYFRVKNRDAWLGPSYWGLDVQIYDLERDEWNCVEVGRSRGLWNYSEIGMWQDRLFVLGVQLRKDLRKAKDPY